ncbi:MAG: hypothetical protein BRC36_10820 [Cyanobacteria bacterium QH_2_48_84]|nr:MAG: hypothetical protein BRC36_10820 [Cyanobacteria bacterium QH_2_48_84]
MIKVRNRQYQAVTSLRSELNDARASQISARRLKVKNARIGLNSLKAWELGLWGRGSRKPRTPESPVRNREMPIP